MRKTTLCYLEKDSCYLMLHRTKKKNDFNEGKWIGVGGKLEEGETVTECLKREVFEETGLTLNSYKPRGIIFFFSEKYEDEEMYLFTSDDFSGELDFNCNEGDLKWIPEEDVLSLNLWEGDRYFLTPMMESDRFFIMSVYYDSENNLVRYEPRGTTFAERVYEATANIPCGMVSKYGDVAVMAGYPGAARAVGNVLHKNPYDEIIPCHRVVNAKGRLATCFGFGDGIQEERLRSEGVIVKDNHVDKKYFL